MCAAWLAICGIVPFAGFFSKDEILWKTYSVSAFPNYAGKVLFVVGLLTAACTAFYMTRLMALTFWTPERFGEGGHADAAHDAHGFRGHRGEEARAQAAHDHEGAEHGHGGALRPHESSPSMTVPLVVLGVLSVIGGWVGIPHALGGHNYFEEWLRPVIVEMGGAHGEAGAHATGETAVELGLMALSVLVAVAAILLARLIYLRRPEIAEKAARAFGGLPYRLSLHKYYVDEFYNRVFPVGATLGLSRVLMRVDARGVDGLPNGSAFLAQQLSRASDWFDRYVVDMLVNLQGWVVRGGSVVLRSVQTGLVQNYALLMILGLLSFFIVLLFAGR
jgi:NADH-quinone oxidoreductase subunit L